MCGFFISNSSKINKKHEKIIEEKLRFRGPDSSSGLIEHNKWKAYHSRLSIIDLSVETNQPMIDSDGGFLVFNGEILNYKELGFKYFNKDFSSDTKLLSELLASKRLNLLELDGFFSFVYVDSQGELAYAARDCFGVKPLYFFEDEDGISFCSEPNVLKELFNCRVNISAIDEYYATRAPIFSDSYFLGIKSVQPGSCYINGTYFDCSDFINEDYVEVNIEETTKALKKGLSTRLVADVPVGLLLSRGIDSNLLRELGQFENYYSIGFEGDEDIGYLQSKKIPGLTTVICTPEEYRAAFEYLLELRGEPMSVPNEVLLYMLSKKAADDGVKVLLSGEGADEFFGGYDRIFTWALEAEEFNLDSFLEKYCYIPPKKGSNLYFEFEKLFENIHIPSVFEKVRWFFIRYHMPILFRRLDFALMAAGVEGREPIANLHTFVNAIKVSPKGLMTEGLGKKPLREIISLYMGKEFAYEKKVGFPVDLTSIFEKKLESESSYEIWFRENIKVLNK